MLLSTGPDFLLNVLVKLSCVQHCSLPSALLKGMLDRLKIYDHEYLEQWFLTWVSVGRSQGFGTASKNIYMS